MLGEVISRDVDHGEGRVRAATVRTADGSRAHVEFVVRTSCRLCPTGHMGLPAGGVVGRKDLGSGIIGMIPEACRIVRTLTGQALPTPAGTKVGPVPRTGSLTR